MIPPPPEDNQDNQGVGSIPPPPVSIPDPEGNLREEVQQELKPEAREKIILEARNAGLGDDDPLFRVLLLIREGDRKFMEAVETMERCKDVISTSLNDAPEKLTAAVADIMRVSQLNREEAILNRENASAGRSLIKWGIGIASVAVILSIAQTVLVSYSTSTVAGIRSERNTLVEQNQQAIGEINSVRTLQTLAGRRLQLESEKRGIEGEWKNLQEAWKLDGATEENQQLKATLEEMNEELSEKFYQLQKEENNAFTR